MAPGKTTEANLFGALRLLLAVAVIVSHAPQLIDGSTSTREPLLRWFGTISLGQFAVDGFIIISGYLVTGSFVQSGSTRIFLLKRVFRIVPGFLAAYLICLLIVAPLAGADLAAVTGEGWVRLAVHMVLLDQPALQGAFAHSPIPFLNGAMWTIGVEFRCYVVAALLGMAGMYRAPRLYYTFTVAIVAAAAVNRIMFPRILTNHSVGLIEAILLSNGPQFLRLLALFLVGGTLRLIASPPALTPVRATVCFVGTILCLSFYGLAEFGIAVFCAYLLIAIGRSPARSHLAALNITDLSYGTYLYAWPISQSLIVAFPGMTPVTLVTATVPMALTLGFASWVLIERPAMRWRGRHHGLVAARQANSR